MLMQTWCHRETGKWLRRESWMTCMHSHWSSPRYSVDTDNGNQRLIWVLSSFIFFWNVIGTSASNPVLSRPGDVYIPGRAIWWVVSHPRRRVRSTSMFVCTDSVLSRERRSPKRLIINIPTLSMWCTRVSQMRSLPAYFLLYWPRIL